MNTTLVEVVAAVIERPDGSFLLAQRPRGKVYAGYWEFPGGKVEPGEPLDAALARELHEELGIDVDIAHPWIVRIYAYPHAKVRLNFFRVRAWHGEPHGKEEQQLAWQHAAAVDVAPLLPANAPVLRALLLPFEYAITHAGEIGAAEQLNCLAQRLAQGLRLIQVREKDMPAFELERFAAAVITLARPHRAQVLINSDIEIALRLGADGVHLAAAQIARLERRPALGWCAASCHNAAELAHAVQLGVDFAVLGPVHATPSHPGSTPLGWEGFAALARGASLPVFALGGMKTDDLETAWRCGAHGIAMVRGSWNRSKGVAVEAGQARVQYLRLRCVGLRFRGRGVRFFVLPFNRYPILFACPGAEVDHFAALGAERPEGRFRAPANRLGAARATDCAATLGHRALPG